jgi:hypothetical protein
VGWQLLMCDAVQSYKSPRAGLSSTPTCTRGIEVHVSRQRTCHGNMMPKKSSYKFDQTVPSLSIAQNPYLVLSCYLLHFIFV